MSADVPLDVDAAALAVTACPSVLRLSGGTFGEVATYLPGRRVTGVRAVGDAVEIHVVARWVASLPAVAEEVRAAVSAVVGSRPITVYIDDIAARETPAVESGDRRGG